MRSLLSWARSLLRRAIARLVITTTRRLLGPRESLVLFAAMSGRFYGDNSRHLFEWVLANKPEVEAVWITHDRAVLRQLRKAGLPVVNSRGLSGLIALARARLAFFTDGLMDLVLEPWIVPDSLGLIALRHGRSVKRVRFARLGHKIPEDESQVKKREGSLIRRVISTSEWVSDLQEECLQVGREKHVVTGYPRNDVLLDVPASHGESWRAYLGSLAPSHVLLYAPSWRHGRYPTRFFPFEDFDEQRLFAMLEENRCLLLMRPHRGDLIYAESRDFFAQLLRCPWVRLATHVELPDVNAFLPFVDLLISDYSALYHDFLLLDRPMLFVPYDYDDFAVQNGFLYDYFELLPGEAIATQSAFEAALSGVISGEDPGRERRRRLRDRIHHYQDSRSCERVAQMIDTV
ncbi:MAG: hypothetical protein CL910_09360 [Deltaproteobacteria bacterium]|jgi:CDP-glycerol glycerophosphotransferase (TagB/SpsB family)|nr:hypothetical protein [Deltaproteobacteria bacterium]